VSGPIELALVVARSLDRLGVEYSLGGSVASSIVGEPRATLDVDMAVVMAPELIAEFLGAFETDFYIPRDALQDAVQHCGSFNMLHAAGLKVDLFVLGEGLLDRLQIERRVKFDIPPGADDSIWVTSPADQILRKLDWYHKGGEVSDRQWRDVVGILAVQATSLDLDDLRGVATEAGLGALLDLALADARGK